MPAKKAITTIGLIIIFLSLGIGAYFVYQKGLLTTSVDDGIKPTKVRITNISSDSFTVSWITESSANGSIAYGKGNKLEEIALDDRDQLTGQSKTYATHHVTLRNLTPSTQYQFKLRSGEKDILFDNEGKNFFQKTAPNLGTTPATDMINGKVLDENGAPSEGTVVYINIAGVTPLSTLTKKDGSWLLSLSSARNSQLTNYANYDKKESLIDIFVQSKTSTTNGKTVSANKSPVPDITLGQAFDFSTQDLAQEIPETPIIEQNIGMGQDLEEAVQEALEEGSSSAELEESTSSAQIQESSASAELEESEEATDSAKDLETFVTEEVDVEINAPAYSGEEFSTSTPTFSGTGETGTIITVEIDGISQGAPVTVDSLGEWDFTPDEELLQGSHVITLSYIDSEGVASTVEEDFEVVLGISSGSGGIPQEEASGSATPSPTPFQYATRSSMPSTTSGTPDSGVNFPTLILLILGSSSLVMGLYWKKLFY